VADTVFVKVESGSIWQSAAVLVEDLRIGVLDGPDEYIFGDVVAVAPDREGGLYAFDRQVPALRQYDSAGRYVRTLGRRGSGPGEYQSVSGVVVAEDGRVWTHDAGLHRVTIYGQDGTPIRHWPVRSGLFDNNSLLVDSNGNVFVKIITERRMPGRPFSGPFPIGLLKMDIEGNILDTLHPPPNRSAGYMDGPLGTRMVWTVHPLATVYGVNNAYEFTVRRGDAPHLRVSRNYARLALSDMEWDAYEALRQWEILDEGPAEHSVPTPRQKPVYRGFEVAEDGRIWVDKYMPATLRPTSPPRAGERPEIPFDEPPAFDVFEHDGAYLGELVLPNRVTPVWFGSRHVYGLAVGGAGEQLIVRFNLLAPPTGRAK